ncbi:MAG: filamentous hemagglutinin N-terminal domain-containing protein [Verrucomicrobiae bacterium]|nr:filamentous hemagglutinin N-terminal domain-containing protein [Verrucomicrobiae bacterium]
MKAIAPSLRRNLFSQALVLVTLLPGLVLQPVSVLANPRNPNVVAGQVNFNGLGTGRLDINNLTNKGNGRAIINWQSFSIDRGEATYIHQGAGGFTMNRVVSGNPTEIYGLLKAAQGGVAVINPNGIVVGQGGAVDVAGMLTMSTLDIDDKDFLNGGRDRYRGNTNAGVVNYGAISSSGGDVVLLGNFLQNAGSVSAPTGTVAFGAGGDIIVDQAGGATISVKSGGGGRGVGIENTGTVDAAAAELKAHGNVYALAIKNDGLVRASGYNFKGGRLTLSAGPQGRIVNTGNLVARNSDGSGGQINVSGGRVELGSSAPGQGRVDASGEAGMAGGSVRVEGSSVEVGASAAVLAGGSVGGSVSIAAADDATVSGRLDAVGASGAGGRVVVEGANISVGSQASVDVSGATGGGTAMIGGGFQGRDASVRNAQTLRVDDGASISANALAAGKGGNIILWSDGDTRFAAELSARGVTQGGFAEISGKSTLDVTGDVDLSASLGASGTLLLDPTDITISSSGAAGLGGSTISNVWLSNQLDAGNNIIISTNIGGTERGNITVGRITTTLEAFGDKVEWYQDSVGTPGGSLTLLAMGDITFNAPVHSAGEGAINVVAGWDGTTGLTMGGFDMDAVLATMNDGNAVNDAAGLSSGSVFLGSIGARIGVDVGSRWGDTKLAAHDLIMRGSTVIGHGWAQLGFNDSGVEYEISRDHNSSTGFVNKINEWWGNAAGNVLGKNYIALLGGTEFGTGDTLTLGDNAFRGAGWGATGDISVGLSGRADARGGTTSSFVQIGHGGPLRDGTQWKRDQNSDGVAGNETQQITRDGIVIDPGDGRRSYFSSTWRTNYAGDAARIDANISLTADGDILFLAHRGFDANDNLNVAINDGNYALIGHGGSENQGSYHGDITVIAHGQTALAGGLDYIGPAGLGIQMLSGRGTRGFAMIGHGSGYEGNRRTIWDQTRSGNIYVEATTGAIRIQAHNQALRDGDINFGGIIDGSTPVPTGNSSDNSNLGSFVQIGHGGQASSAPTTGGIFQMPGGTNVNNILPDNSMTGDITVLAAGTYEDPNNSDTPIGILLRAGNRRWQHALIGHGGTNHFSTNATDLTPNFGGGSAPFGTPTLAASTGYNGNIRVEADQGSVIATGGDNFRADRVWGYGLNFVQIGHGGDTVRGNKGGTITVLAGQGAGATAGDINFQAGRMFRDHAMLGHGGFDSDGNILGADNTAEIVVTAYGDVSFVSPPSGDKDALGLNTDYASWWFNGQTGQPGFWQTEDRFVQLGHGGRANTMVMPNRQDISVTSGTGDVNNADGDATTGGVTFIAGDMERDYAQLGHGGHQSGANNTDGFTGDINVNALGGGIRFDSSILGAQAARRDTNRSLDGVAVQTVVQGYGGGYEAYSQLGHGGYGTRGINVGDIVVNAWGGLSFLAAPAAPTVGREILSTNGMATTLAAGMTAGTNVWIPLANLRDTAAPVGGAGVFQVPEQYSNIVPGTLVIELSDGSTITDVVEASSDDRDSTSSTAAGLFRNGTKIGDIHYDWGLVRFQVGGAAGPVPGSGATVDRVTYETAQGLKERSYVQLGHGGYDADGPNNKANNLLSNLGDITIKAGGDIRFEGGAAHRNYAQLGHGGLDVKGINAGDITIDHVDATHQVGGIRFIAGYGGHRHFDYQSYVQLGHGGSEADGNHYGNIFVRGTEDSDGMGLFFKAGDHLDSTAQLGLGGRNARSGTGDGANSFGLNGDIDIQVGGDVAFVAGTFSRKNDAWTEDGRIYAILGHGGWDADPSANNNTNYGQSRTNPALPIGTDGAGEGNWGHFGDITLVSTDGDISFMAGNNSAIDTRVDIDGNSLGLPADPNGFLTSFGGGNGRFHFAQLGHGGYATGGDHYGNITVSAENGSVHVVGGMSTNDNSAEKFNYAQIGHGSNNAPGNVGHADETIKVHALGATGNVVVIGGEARRNSAQIGNGGQGSSGSNLGDLSVIAGNNLYLNSGAGIFAENWGKIGHGDVRNGGSGVRDGNIHVSVGNTLRMGQAVLGHVDFRLTPGYFAGLTDGNTYIAVGRRNPHVGGTGSIITTSSSVITSAGGGTSGELRLYIPDANANKIAQGTYLNNVDYNRTPAPGTNRADEQIAVEHEFPVGAITESDAVFTPEGDYPFHAFGLYNIYYGGAAPITPPGPPTPPVPPLPPIPGFDFMPFVFGDTYDAFFRYEDLFLYDGYDEVLASVALSDAMEDDSPPATGATFLEEVLDGSFGDRRFSEIGPGSDVLGREDDEELERRKRRASQQVGKGALTYYVFDPGTNRYSSYRVFGVEQSRLSVTQ